MVGHHLSDEEIASFVAQKMANGKRAEVHSHIEGCQLCRDLLVEMAASLAAEATPSFGEPLTVIPDVSTDRSQLSASFLAEPLLWNPPTHFEEFRLLRRLGEGAMGQVHLAADTLLERRVAIKFLTSVRSDPVQHKRFLNEARAIARVVNPHVIGLYRVGEVSGHPYLVYEYVPGQSLDELHKPLSWQMTLGIATDLAQGLCAAHRCGVLHRDLKPGNAMLTQSGSVKLLDFGLASVEEAHLSTQDGLPRLHPDSLPQVRMSVEQKALVGTPLYLAPERWRGTAATPQSDLYSLGALLFELLIGHPPFQSDSLDDLRTKILTAPVPSLVPSVPPECRGLAELVEKCLARDPACRPRSAEEVFHALARLRPQQHRRLLLPTMILILLVVVGVSVALWQSRVVNRWLRPKMVEVASGSFVMGSGQPAVASAWVWCKRDEQDCPLSLFERELPERRVTVSSFFLDTTEVTTFELANWLNQLGKRGDIQIKSPKPDEQWVYAQDEPLVNLYPWFQPTYEIQYRADHQDFYVAKEMELKPARQVTWYGAQRYCQSLGKRLPTEAEWEFAARGPEGRRFPWGDLEPDCRGVMFALWDYAPGTMKQRRLRCSGFHSGLFDVGTAEQDVTPLGIYDLGGNAAEWVADAYQSPYPSCPQPCKDPQVRGSNSEGRRLRTFRGGSYSNPAVMTRSATRGKYAPDVGLTDVGFRCARSK